MKQSSILISIVIPIFNMEKYLRRCLESIKNQTFRNFEVILIDDGSEDASEEICRDFLGDTRFVYRKQRNQGVSCARNTGLGLASGVWVAFVDPDDYLESEFLEILTRYCNLEDVDIISCCCRTVDDSDNHICHFFDGNQYFWDKDYDVGVGTLRGFERANGKLELLKQLMYGEYPDIGDRPRVTAIGVPWGKLYRKDFLDQYELKFDKDLIRMQDNIFNMYAFDKARCILYVDQGLYCYSVRHIQSIQLKFDDRIHNYLGKVIKLRREYMMQNKLMDDAELYQLYLGEGAILIAEMCQRYFFHSEWKEPFEVRVRKIDAFFGNNIYGEVVGKYREILSDRLSILGRIRFFLLKHKRYCLLSLAEKINRIRYSR